MLSVVATLEGIPCSSLMSTSILLPQILSYHDTKRKADLGENVVNGCLERCLHDFERDTVAKLVNSRLKEGL